MSDSRVRRCPECHGSGWVSVYPGNGCAYFYEAKCTRCEGTGVVIVPKPIRAQARAMMALSGTIAPGGDAKQ